MELFIIIITIRYDSFLFCFSRYKECDSSVTKVEDKTIFRSGSVQIMLLRDLFFREKRARTERNTTWLHFYMYKYGVDINTRMNIRNTVKSPDGDTRVLLVTVIGNK